MDPCPFVRILVGNLAVKSPAWSKTSSLSGKVHPSSSPFFFCKIKVKGVSWEAARSSVPLVSETDPTPHSLAASFDFPKAQILKASKIKISVYKGPTTPTCLFSSAKLLGHITIPLDLASAQARPCTFHNGWLHLSKNTHSQAQAQAQAQAQLLHLTVRADPDPRFLFRFDGGPECSPQVFQVKGDVKQPVFTCKFSFRDRDQNPNPNPVHPPPLNRKGWSVTVHDLSGSPVAAASMVTPFVPSPGSHRVSRANPGSWLIIRPDGDGTWKPWGRLEAWRQPNAAVGYRFEVLPATADPVTLAASTISSQHGGRFSIDATSGVTPANTPRGSWDLGSGSSTDLGFESQLLYKGFVMSATVNGDGKCSKPEVEVGVHHVTCTEDAAAFVALAAALDLSMEACKLFSQKLRKELRQWQ